MNASEDYKWNGRVIQVEACHCSKAAGISEKFRWKSHVKKLNVFSGRSDSAPVRDRGLKIDIFYELYFSLNWQGSVFISKIS